MANNDSVELVDVMTPGQKVSKAFKSAEKMAKLFIALPPRPITVGLPDPNNALTIHPVWKHRIQLPR